MINILHYGVQMLLVDGIWLLPSSSSKGVKGVVISLLLTDFFN